jgi:hypothetical protein
MVSGLNGTPMPSYVGTAPDEDLWAVAAFIDSIRAADPAREPLNNSTDLDPLAAKMAPGIKFGYWPYSGDDIAEADIWGKTIPFQGEPPAGLTPAQTSLEADRCTRCHAKQRREWRDSFHAQASSPGLIAQLIPMEQNHNGAPLESCQRCHQPLAEQQPLIRPGHSGGDDKSRDYSVNPLYKSDLRDEAINCAACHVRKWKRHGPKPTPDSKLLELPNYPFEEMAIYERADFCLACHQTPPKAAVDGKPLLNTYREWLEGPYMRLGVQCQHCHMPNREHTWRGVHDPETFRQGFDIEAIAARSEKTGAVSVRTRMTNVGAGHYLPTTPTPAAWISIQLVDRRGRKIRGAFSEKRIGRHIAYKKKKWREIEDTRIPPGEHLELAAAWIDGRVPKATHAKIVVRVHPDDYYEGLYEQRLTKKHSPEVKEMFEEALKRGRDAHYIAYEKLVPIAE